MEIKNLSKCVTVVSFKGLEGFRKYRKMEPKRDPKSHWTRVAAQPPRPESSQVAPHFVANDTSHQIVKMFAHRSGPWTQGAPPLRAGTTGYGVDDGTTVAGNSRGPRRRVECKPSLVAGQNHRYHDIGNQPAHKNLPESQQGHPGLTTHPQGHHSHPHPKRVRGSRQCVARTNTHTHTNTQTNKQAYRIIYPQTKTLTILNECSMGI